MGGNDLLCWAVRAGLAFLVLAAVAAWQRPPLTPRGRVFYALAGVSGAFSGGVWLLFNAAFCGAFGGPSGEAQRHPAEVLAEVFSPDPPGLAFTSLLATAFFSAGVYFLLKASFGSAPGPHD